MIRRACEGRELGGVLLDDGRVLVERAFVGKLEGFRFAPKKARARQRLAQAIAPATRRILGETEAPASFGICRGAPAEFVIASGYWPMGARAYRIDALEEVAAEARARAVQGACDVVDAWAQRLGIEKSELRALIVALGHAVRVRGEGGPQRRSKRRRMRSFESARRLGPTRPTGP